MLDIKKLMRFGYETYTIVLGLQMERHSRLLSRYNSGRLVRHFISRFDRSAIKLIPLRSKMLKRVLQLMK